MVKKDIFMGEFFLSKEGKKIMCLNLSQVLFTIFTVMVDTIDFIPYKVKVFP